MADLSIVAIIPLYNGARWIEQSIRSILAQTLQPDEFIVVDDGSTDGGAGAAVVERLAKEHPITLLRKPNGGQASARNFAVAHSKSALIALLDQDDAWYPHHLQELVRPFRKQKSGVPLGWVYSNLDEIDESGAMVHRMFLDVVPQIIGKPLEFPRRNLVACLDRDMFILPSASLIDRAAFEAIGGFDERLSGYEDDDLFLRLFRAGYDNVFVNKSLSKWRIYPGSTSYTYRMAKSRIIYAQKLFEMFPDDRRMSRFFARDCVAPRFMLNTFTDVRTALERRDATMFRTALSHLRVLLPHLKLKHRVMLGTWLALFSNFHLATIAYRVRYPLRPMTDKVKPEVPPSYSDWQIAKAYGAVDVEPEY